MHALVLDAVEKITRDDQGEGYEIGDVKLVFKNTHDNEENGKPKKYTINAKNAKAPDVFYFVHIDVDLDQIANCSCQEKDCKCRNNDKSVNTTDATSDSENPKDLQKSQTSDNDDLMSVNADQSETSDDEPEEKKPRV